ncbi:hypothetical protein RIF29_34228 [Crotalaria pallida]|uniref:TF-B3 domain-containing protein n=1 Tax=Crotalaria pallida TaxID=3830 RepID=A0AAN9EEM0_CROPI
MFFEDYQGTDYGEFIYKDLDGNVLEHIFSALVTRGQLNGYQTLPIPATIRDNYLTIGQEFVLVKGRDIEPQKWYIKWNHDKNNYYAFAKGWYGYVQANRMDVDDIVDFFLNKTTSAWVVTYLRTADAKRA